MPSKYASAALQLPGGTGWAGRFGGLYSDVIVKTIGLDGRGERRGGGEAENKTVAISPRDKGGRR